MEHLLRLFARGFVVVGAMLAIAADKAWAGPQNWLNPGGPVAEMQLSLFMLTTWIMVGVFVVVSALLVYAIIKFRDKGAADVSADGTTVARETAAAEEGDLPPQFEGDVRLEILLTIVPFILLIIMAIPTVNLNFALAADPEGDPLNVRVVGHQWWWEFEYTDLGIVTGNELRIPTGRPVVLSIESADVIHKFWVPRLAGKLDAIPGRVNKKWIQADEPDVYWGQCAEMCGTHHANMRMRVVALPPEEFDQWVANYGRGPVTDTPEQLAAAERGKALFETKTCFACHTIEGTIAHGTVGPNLTDFGGRLTVAAGMMDNTRENLARWIADPQAVKPGSGMPRVAMSDDEIADLVTYLHSLK